MYTRAAKFPRRYSPRVQYTLQVSVGGRISRRAVLRILRYRRLNLLVEIVELCYPIVLEWNFNDESSQLNVLLNKIQETLARVRVASAGFL